MKYLTFDEFKTLDIKQPLTATYDNSHDDAVIDLQKNDSRSTGWLAIPTEWEIHGDQIDWLSSYCKAHDVQQMIGFSPKFTSNDEIMLGEPSANNIQETLGNFCLRASTIIPFPGIFQVYSDGDYYSILAGPPDIFLAVLGVGPEEGMQKFINFMERSYKPERLEYIRLAKVVRTCNAFNAGLL